jgi:hypothetical protein
LINPTRIVPVGPDLDFLSPHGRERRSGQHSPLNRTVPAA